MNWYYTNLGGHTHVRVFMNGGKCGDLCFRNEEFELIKKRQDALTNSGVGHHYTIIQFVNEIQA